MGAVTKCLMGLIILFVVSAGAWGALPEAQDNSISSLEAKIASQKEPFSKGDLLLRLGDVCEHQQNFTQAEEAFENAVEVTKNLSTRDMALQRLCRFYDTHQQLDTKISAWELDAGKMPPDLDAVRALVVALFNVKRDFEHAIPWLEVYARMDASDAYRSELLAQAYKHHGDHEKAAQRFNDLASRVKDARSLHYRMEAIDEYIEAGNKEEAAQMLTFLESAPSDNLAVQKKLAYWKTTLGVPHEAN